VGRRSFFAGMRRNFSFWHPFFVPPWPAPCWPLTPWILVTSGNKIVKRIIWDMTPQGAGLYGGGKI
jgi:hypothetical protein